MSEQGSVVEDEVFIRLDVSEALRAAGFEVIEAKSADDAASFIETGEPLDVVFLRDQPIRRKQPLVLSSGFSL